MSDDPLSSRPDIERRTARDVRAEHRVLLSFSDADLAKMSLIPEGTRLARGGWYLDLHNPAKADFPATGDETVEPGQHMLARKEVSAELWDELRRACDGVLGRPSDLYRRISTLLKERGSMKRRTTWAERLLTAAILLSSPGVLSRSDLRSRDSIGSDGTSSGRPAGTGAQPRAAHRQDRPQGLTGHSTEAGAAADRR